MSEEIRSREPRAVIIGSLLILIGITLLLDRLNVFYFRWDRLFWLMTLFLGGFFAVDGFLRKRRGRVFWGSMLFFISVYYVLLQWRLIDRYDFYTLPVILIALGFSFVSLYLYEPREVALLIPAILFVGTGTAAILWWWEVLEWYEIRHAIRVYWPLLFVVWGIALIVKRKPGHPPTPGSGPTITS